MTKKLTMLTVVLIFAAVTTMGLFAQADEKPTDVASVNGTVIKSDDVKREMNMMYQRAVQSGVYPDSSEIEAYWTQAVETLIGREILYQDAVSRGYSPDNTKIDEYIASLTQNYGGEEALISALSSQGLSIEKLRNDTGVYYVISEYVTRELRLGVSVSDAEVKAYYDEHKEMFKQEETVEARHILLAVEDASDEAAVEEAGKKISALRERIEGGEDFSELAKEYSDCPSGENGGSLGEFGRGRMVPPFDRAAFSLEVGVLSEPVLTQFGWHLIEVTAKNGGGTVALADIEPRLREYLENVALEDKVTSHVDELRENCEIIIF